MQLKKIHLYLYKPKLCVLGGRFDLFYSKFANTLYCILRESVKPRGRDYRMYFAKQDVRTAVIICREKSDVVVVVSHIQRIGCQPEKNYFTWWPIPLVVC